MNFNKEEIIQLLIERYQEIVKGDVIYDAYETLLSHIVENGTLFPVCSKGEFSSVTTDKKHGIYSEYNGRKCVWMLKDKFEKFVRSIPNVNFDMLRRGFRDRGYIGYFDESYLRKQKIGSAEVSCYCIYLDYGCNIPDEKNEIKEKAKKAVVRIKSQANILLSEDAG